MAIHVKHLCISGPESTGKSTLSSALASKYNAALVTEFARDYLTGREDYIYEDLMSIAVGQKKALERAMNSHNVVVSDTDLLTIVIWSRFVFGKVDIQILRWWYACLPDKYILCTPDIPWENDPLREHPKQRNELFSIYKMYIELSGVPYDVVEGDRNEFAQSFDLKRF